MMKGQKNFTPDLHIESATRWEMIPISQPNQKGNPPKRNESGTVIKHELSKNINEWVKPPLCAQAGEESQWSFLPKGIAPDLAPIAYIFSYIRTPSDLAHDRAGTASRFRTERLNCRALDVDIGQCPAESASKQKRDDGGHAGDQRGDACKQNSCRDVRFVVHVLPIRLRPCYYQVYK